MNVYVALVCSMYALQGPVAVYSLRASLSPHFAVAVTVHFAQTVSMMSRNRASNHRRATNDGFNL
jgi:hypothetical protein